jgi:hypothetical protein
MMMTLHSKNINLNNWPFPMVNSQRTPESKELLENSNKFKPQNKTQRKRDIVRDVLLLEEGLF